MPLVPGKGAPLHQIPKRQLQDYHVCLISWDCFWFWWFHFAFSYLKIFCWKKSMGIIYKVFHYIRKPLIFFSAKQWRRIKAQQICKRSGFCRGSSIRQVFCMCCRRARELLKPQACWTIILAPLSMATVQQLKSSSSFGFEYHVPFFATWYKKFVTEELLDFDFAFFTCRS